MHHVCPTTGIREAGTQICTDLPLLDQQPLSLTQPRDAAMASLEGRRWQDGKVGTGRPVDGIAQGEDGDPALISDPNLIPSPVDHDPGCFKIKTASILQLQVAPFELLQVT